MDERPLFEPQPIDLTEAERVPPPLRWKVPIVLFVLTCGSTFLVGGPAFAVALMGILLAHEFGHYFQARRYGVPASLPYFLPMPLSPIGTLGAVIAMRPQGADRRALFDVAITGPIAGLIPALGCSYFGLTMSRFVTAEGADNLVTLGEPLIFKAMSYLIYGPLPEGQDIVLHPIAYAGWVGLLITALNLMPIGQLDGGHILYSLLPRYAFAVSLTLLYGAIVATIFWRLWHWSLMLLLLVLLVRHPPAAREEVPIDRTRVVLGWLMLLFVLVGFTPTPWNL